jgi:cell division protein FtsB
MKMALELDDALSDISVLLQEQNYDDALSVLGDLMEKHPADRETQMYRLLVARILVLRHSLSPTTASEEALPITANSPAPARGFRRFLFGTHGQPQTDRLAQLESRVAASVKESAELRAKGKELLAEVNLLSNKLLASETSVTELQAMQNRAQFENQQLQATNLELQQAIANFEHQLERSETRLGESAGQAQEIGEQNSKLQAEVVKLTRSLEAMEQMIEDLEAGQRHLLDTRSENEKLHAENQQLHQEIVSLRNELQTIESRLGEAANRHQRLAADYGRLQIEFAESQRKAPPPDALRQQLAEVESHAIASREERHKLEAQIAKLQQELSTREEKIEELDRTRRRLGKVEDLCQRLAAENRRLKNEVLRWQERGEESVENQKQINASQQQLAESQYRTGRTSAGSQAIVPIATAEETKPATWRSKRGRSRLETIPATAVIVIAVAIALGLLNTSSRKTSEPKEPAVVLQTVSNDAPAAIRTDFERRAEFEAAAEPIPQSATTLAKTAVAKQKTGVKAAQRVQGMFKITRETALFNGPSENAALISSIRPGMKITVVDSRNGWLEIRSQHGRPSGFIRQDAAVRADEN